MRSSQYFSGFNVFNLRDLYYRGYRNAGSSSNRILAAVIGRYFRRTTARPIAALWCSLWRPATQCCCWRLPLFCSTRTYTTAVYGQNIKWHSTSLCIILEA